MKLEDIEKKKIISFQKKLYEWFLVNKRRYPWRNKSATNYEKIIAEFLLKRTTAKSASELFPKFIKKYPSWKKLSTAGEKEIEKVLRPIGLYRQRALALKSLSAIISNKNGRFPRKKKEILSLPGVGEYVANAVLLFCYNEKQPLIDSNMSRVLSRYFGIRNQKSVNNKRVRAIAEQIADTDDAVSMNWAVLDYSATVCHYRYPKCDTCALSYYCSSYDSPNQKHLSEN